jgi:hypothetical protein
MSWAMPSRGAFISDVNSGHGMTALHFYPIRCLETPRHSIHYSQPRGPALKWFGSKDFLRWGCCL